MGVLNFIKSIFSAGASDQRHYKAQYQQPKTVSEEEEIKQLKEIKGQVDEIRNILRQYTENPIDPAEDYPSDCSYCPDITDPRSFLTFEEIKEVREKEQRIEELIDNNKYEEALNLIEAIIPEAPHFDHTSLSTNVYLCFMNQTVDMKPWELLDFYDRMALRNPQAVEFAIKHGELDDMADMIHDAFLNIEMPTWDTLRKCLEVVQRDHILVNAFHADNPKNAIEHLDNIAAEVSMNWQKGRHKKLPKLIEDLQSRMY